MLCPECGAQNADEARACVACRRDLSDLGLTIDRLPIGATEHGGASSRPPRSDSTPRDHASSGAKFRPDTDLNARYHIIRQLGEGGMGEVYLAFDRELDRDVALKLIRTELTSHPAILERFRREIQLATRITHKNVLRVYDLGDANGLKFLTMQYCDGTDLSAVLRREGMPLPRVIEVFRQICEGLGAAHEQGVIHRDLKPQNIMIDRQGHVLITDFGLAKSFEQVSLTEAGKIIGTPHYMSPEQVKGVALDQRSDIYSLGVMLYEMLTGTVPFTGSSAYEIMIQRIQKTPRPASDHNPKIPPYLLKILQRCLEPDPALRYSSTSEILHDLDTQTVRSTFGRRVLHSRRFMSAAGAFALIAIVLVLAGVIGQRALRDREQARVAGHKPVSVLIADLENRTGDAVFDGTLEPILTLAMEGASFVSSYNRAQARRVATQIQPKSSALDERLARLVAVREGLNVVVAGTISGGDSYHLALRALDAVTGKPIENSEVTAKSKEEVLTAVGRAAADLRKALGDTTPVSTQLAAAETFTAGSLEAAHEYAQGQDLLYSGKFEDAARHYEQAIKLDPDLGRAYAGLAIDYANMGRRGDAENYYKLAMSHIDRMTDREKYRTRAGYYLLTRNNTRAIEELNQLLKGYPADMAGLNNLPIAYFYSRDMSRALEESQRVITVYPKNYVARNNAALYAMYAGDFPTAIKQAQTVLAMNPAYVKAYVAIALSQLGQNDIAAATETYKRMAAQGASGQSTATIGLADVALYEGRSADAVKLLKEGADRDLAEKRTDAANRKLATLADVAGNVRAAEQVLATGTHDEHALYTTARAFLQAGKNDRAMAVASRLDSQIESELQHYGKLIEGEVLLHSGKAREALTRFDDARRIADSWLARFDRGRAYLELGAFTEADADFEVCAKRRGEAAAIFLDDVPTFHYFPPVYYYLGRAQEGLGSSSAAESYKQFLAIRSKGQDALTTDAQKRLALLKAR